MPPGLVRVLEMNHRYVISGVGVTLLDANHCPGAAMMLFEIPSQSPPLKACGAAAASAVQQVCLFHVCANLLLNLLSRCMCCRCVSQVCAQLLLSLQSRCVCLICIRNEYLAAMTSMASWQLLSRLERSEVVRPSRGSNQLSVSAVKG